MELTTGYIRPGKAWPTDLSSELDSENTLVMAFGTPAADQAGPVLKELSTMFPLASVIGCSTAGEVFGTRVEDGGVAVAVVKFHQTEIRCASAHLASTDQSFAAGSRLAEELSAEGLKGVLVLSPGVRVNGTALVRGLTSVLGDDVVVTGGLAGDGSDFVETWTMADNELQTDTVAAVGMYGDNVRIGHGTKGGWDMFGPQRVVTRAVDNVLFELDGKPALELYKSYLGDLASDLPGSGLLFPLAIRENATDEHMLVRTILAVDENDQSMTFAGDVPVGSIAQLMHANFDRVIEGAADAAVQTSIGDPVEGEVLAIAVSCVGRRLVLGERIEEELDAALDALPEQARLIGFYSYGEISPHASGRCELHNQTMTLTTISETTT